MLTDNLYKKVLIDPIHMGANRLYIVSGYASATMASKHIEDILKFSKECSINLIIGMCSIDGLGISIHKNFVDLMETDIGVDFQCKYVYEGSPVHSKVYAWYKNDRPLIAFAGSANYTQPAFSSKQKEVLVACDAEKAYNYYEEIEAHTIYCNHGELEEFIKITRVTDLRWEEDGSLYSYDTLVQSSNKVTLSLLQRGGEVAPRSGLNWGQRENRDPNEAYIPVPAKIARTGFFPLNGAHFTVLTDDGKQLILRSQQQNYKAITTPLNNALIGEYFRNRLGLANGQFVTREHLENYGRTSVDFYKIDEETFYMDFSTDK